MSAFETYLGCWRDDFGNAKFWHSDRGLALVAELDVRFVDAILARFVSQMKTRCPLDREEVLATVVLLLMDEDKLSKIAGDTIADPAAYLCVVATNEIVRHELGTLARSVEDDTNAFRSTAVVDVPEIQSLEVLVATPHGDVATLGVARTGDLTPIGEACKSATAKLTPYVPAYITADVRVVVDWFALNPPQHRGHGHSQAAREPFLRDLGLSEKQTMAFAKILWGTRYREPETSLLGWYMTHPGSNPGQSRTHSEALAVFRQEMACTRATIRRKAVA